MEQPPDWESMQIRRLFSILTWSALLLPVAPLTPVLYHAITGDMLPAQISFLESSDALWTDLSARYSPGGLDATGAEPNAGPGSAGRNPLDARWTGTGTPPDANSAAGNRGWMARGVTNPLARPAPVGPAVTPGPLTPAAVPGTPGPLQNRAPSQAPLIQVRGMVPVGAPKATEPAPAPANPPPPAPEGKVGLKLFQRKGVCFVQEVIPGTPAAQAEIQPGERLFAVNAQSIEGLGIKQVTDLIKGLPETEVILTLRRPGQGPREVKIPRVLLTDPEKKGVVATSALPRFKAFASRDERPSMMTALAEIQAKGDPAELKEALPLAVRSLATSPDAADRSRAEALLAEALERAPASLYLPEAVTRLYLTPVAAQPEVAATASTPTNATAAPAAKAATRSGPSVKGSKAAPHTPAERAIAVARQMLSRHGASPDREIRRALGAWSGILADAYKEQKNEKERARALEKAVEYQNGHRAVLLQVSPLKSGPLKVGAARLGAAPVASASPPIDPSEETDQPSDARTQRQPEVAKGNTAEKESFANASDKTGNKGRSSAVARAVPPPSPARVLWSSSLGPRERVLEVAKLLPLPQKAQAVADLAMEVLRYQEDTDASQLLASAIASGARDDRARLGKNLWPVIATEAPDVEMIDTAGTPHRLSALKGKVVLISLWATWCGPCNQEMEAFKSVYARYKDQGLEILAISVDQETELVAPWVKRKNLTFPAGLAEQRPSLYRTSNVPVTFLVDRSGGLAYTHVGYSESSFIEVEKQLKTLLAAPGGVPQPLVESSFGAEQFRLMAFNPLRRTVDVSIANGPQGPQVWALQANGILELMDFVGGDGNGVGSLRSAGSRSGYNGYNRLEALDVDGDRLSDVAVYRFGEGDVVVESTLSDLVKLFVPFNQGVHDVKGGDLDGDGRDELLVAYRDGGVRAFSPEGVPLWWDTTSHPRQLVPADLSGDGIPEVLYGEESGPVHVLSASGTRLAELDARGPAVRLAVSAMNDPQPDGNTQIFGVDIGLAAPVSADLDGDGKAEWAARVGESLLILDHDGNLAARFTLAGSTFVLAAADLDSDGRDELIAGGEGLGVVVLGLLPDRTLARTGMAGTPATPPSDAPSRAARK